MTKEIDGAYITKVLNTLSSNPTAESLDFLVEAHARVGYYAAVAEGLAEEAEARRKWEEANIIMNGRIADPKVPVSVLEAAAAVNTYDHKNEEIKADTNARKLSNLLGSIEQAINAIKFLGRETGVRIH